MQVIFEGEWPEGATQNSCEQNALDILRDVILAQETLSVVVK